MYMCHIAHLEVREQLFSSQSLPSAMASGKCFYLQSCLSGLRQQKDVMFFSE